MKDYVQRMIEENSQLNERIAKLQRAIENKEFMHDIGEEKSSALVAQYHAMQSYAYILGLRLTIEGVSC